MFLRRWHADWDDHQQPPCSLRNFPSFFWRNSKFTRIRRFNKSRNENWVANDIHKRRNFAIGLFSSVFFRQYREKTAVRPTVFSLATKKKNGGWRRRWYRTASRSGDGSWSNKWWVCCGNSFCFLICSFVFLCFVISKYIPSTSSKFLRLWLIYFLCTDFWKDLPDEILDDLYYSLEYVHPLLLC